MGSVFLGRRKSRKQKAAEEGEQLAAANPPFPLTDWRRRRPLEYLLLSFVFCSFFSSLRCWEVLYLFICSLSQSSASSSILPFTWSTISSIYEETGSRETEKETEEGRGIFFLSPSSPLSSIHPSLLYCYPCLAHAPSLPPTLPPPLPFQPPSTRNFAYSYFDSSFDLFPLSSSNRVI